MPFIRPIDNQALYSEVLHPTPKKSYNSKFFKTLDYEFIDLKGTCNSTDDSLLYTDKKVRTVFLIFIKLVAIISLTAIKAVLVLTIITPLVLEIVSVYQNRKITANNKDLKRKAIAFVKASEAHISLGNAKDAYNALMHQDKVMNIKDSTNPNALRNSIKCYQDQATLHYNLVVTSKEWGDIIKNRSNVGNEEGNVLFDQHEFFKYATQTLVNQGHTDKMNMNQINAEIVLWADPYR